MKRYNLLMLVLFLIPVFVSSQVQNFTIEGKVSSKYNGKFIKIYYEESGVKNADSASVDRGKFKIIGTVSSPTVGLLTFEDRSGLDGINIFLSAGKIKVIAQDSIHHAKVLGNKLVQEHEELDSKFRREYFQMLQNMILVKNTPKGDQQVAYTIAFLKLLDSYNALKKEAIHQFVKEYPSSYVSLYYLSNYTPGRLLNYETTFPYYALLSSALQSSPLGQEFYKRLLAVQGEFVNKAYMDFTSITRDNKKLSLKEVVMNNKYTLLDFWASWCGPCRKENPYVVKTYEAFKDKGFTVLSVSLDSDKIKWEAAIEEDGMPWHHVSSLKGWKEPAAQLYKVAGIPFNALIDGNGKIIAVNLKGETLFEKIQQLVKGSI